MELQLWSSDNTKSTIEVSSDIFDKPYNEPLIHQVVTAYMAGARQGSHAQKTRAEVSGSGKKPWQQKRLGRARAGSKRSPIWRGGGVTFAAKPQDYSQKVNKKMYRSAMKAILSELIRQERLVVVETMTTEQPKTKMLQAELAKYNLNADNNSLLIVTHELDENLFLSARNLPKVDVIDTIMLDPMSLVKFDMTIMTREAVKQIEETLV